MAAQSVKIPVELELKTLQSSIGTLEKALNSVKPGTKIYNYLSQQLERVKRDFLGLQVAAEKSYTKIGQIKGFEKNFNKVADEIQILARSFDSLQFDDLNFGKNDLKEITSLQEAIARIKKEISSVNTDAFKNLFSNSTELQETFKDLHLNINTEDAEQAIKKVAQALDKIDLEEKRINRNTNSKMGEITELDKRIDDLKNFKNIITNLDDVEYFKKDKSFKNKNKFIQDWSERLGIDEESLRALTSNGAKKMIDAYEEMEKEVQRKLDAASKDRAKKQKTINDNQSKLSELSEKKQLYSAALVKMQDIGIDPAVIAELDKLQKALQTAQRELAEMKAELIALKGPGNQTKGVIEDTGDAARKVVPSINSSTEAIENLNAQIAKLNSMQNAIKQWFGFNEVINLTKRTVRDAIDHIRELDKAMTEIAVVTDMDQDDLWGQIGTYSKIAQEYGVSTVGVYEVSQLYYQQGLATAEVMQLTEETLKMAKIANIDYAEATDYMTVAIRGFKMEMSDAQNVVDVYSNIAAITASDTEELAVAMSKTASSAEAVGASFENTTAMIALMVETTREAPQNIGSALKSIISRYGEMTSDPMKLVDSEGEEMSLNKVDKALKSIGISLQDTTGQFRAFDEVILELSSKWETLDVNTQRYLKVA